MNRMKQKLLLVLFCLMATVSKAQVQFIHEFPYTGKPDVKYALYFETNTDGANTVTINQSYFPYNEKTELVIPKEVKYGGQTYTVTRIDNGISSGESQGVFAGKNNITSLVIPNSVTTIGYAAFWSCKGIQSIVLGNQVRDIGDYAFQYCEGLTSISLPNSLEKVGDHFLCHCPKLETLVVPENLVTIGAYFLHGCQGLRKVYLVGGKQRTLGDYPFVSQDQHGDKQVNGCTFYVDSEQVYANNYQSFGNWRYIDENNSETITGDGSYINQNLGNGKNRYEWASKPDDIRPMEAKWITARYPTDVDARAEFGENALVAVMTKAQYTGKDEKGNYAYHADFELVPDGIMKANTPYLLKADPKNVGSAYIVKHVDDEAGIADDVLSVSVNIDNNDADPSSTNTQIKMLGTFNPVGRELQDGEFLFSNNNGTMRFFKKTAGGSSRKIGTYRCYWQIIKDGVVATDAKLGSTDAETTDVELDVIVYPSVKGRVFNLQGQLVSDDVSVLSGLPKGIYVVNGKKIIIN